jgi:hypothetical protein
MIHNSTNINKQTINSHLNSLNTKKTMTYDIGNLGPGLGQTQRCGGLNWLMGSQSSPLDYWISVGLNWLMGSQSSPLDYWISVGLNWLMGSQSSPLDYWISVGLNWLMRSQSSPLDYWISNGNAYIRELHQWCNGWRVKPKTIELVFVASPLSTQH